MNRKVWFALLLTAALSLCCMTAAGAAPDTQCTNSLGMEFVLVPAGSLSRVVGKNEFNEDVFSKAIISKPFYLGKYEVTQEQWVAVMGRNPARFPNRHNPVERVSWDAVQEFIKRLNAQEGHKRYRLPTEAEWEYAARAGTNTLYSFGDDVNELSKHAWCKDNAANTTHPVGQKLPNAWGLYDVHGNVWEWVQDWHGKLPTDQEIRDYHGPKEGARRVNRGGCWDNVAKDCRSDSRYHGTPSYDYSFVGFRLAISPE